MNKLEAPLPCPLCGWVGSTKPEIHQLPAGTVLKEHYLLGEVLGQGGFGITYIGRDLARDHRIAVKEFFPSNCAIRDATSSSEITVSGSRQEKVLAEGKEKMLQEAEVLRQLKNVSGIVDVYDFFEDNNTVYIVMEYLDGSDLRTILDNHTIPAEELFYKIVPLMQSLSEVHSRNLIHRDISPDNIMMLKDGSLKLMDFGAARESNEQDDHSISVILKSGYAPVEQYSGKGTQGPWTDIYALCATMYKCITGVTPEESLQRLLRDSIQWPSELGIEISPHQEEVLKKGMAVKKEDRYPDLSSLLTDLQLADPDETISKDEDVTVSVGRISNSSNRKEPKEKKKKRKISVRRVLTVLGILVILSGVGALGYRMSPAYVERLVQKGEMIHIALAPESGYEDAFEDNTAILKERLNIFAGRRNYRLRKSGSHSADLYLPAKAFGEADPDKVLRFCLTCEGRMYLVDRTYTEDQQDPVVINPDYIEQIDSAYGAIPNLNISKDTWEDPEYDYLTLHLNKEGRKILSGIRPENAIIASDVFDRNILSDYRYHLYPSYFGQDPFPDPIYIMNFVKDLSCPEYMPLIEYLFTHEPMKGHLEYDIEELIRWETGTKEDAGANQQAESEIPEDSLTLILRHEDINITSGMRVDTMDIIKKRCDSLDLPYAFGSMKDDKNSFAVKIGRDHLNPGILHYIANRNIKPKLTVGTQNLSISLNDISVEEEEGKTGLQIAISQEADRKILSDLVQSEPDLLCRFSISDYISASIPFLQDSLGDAFDGTSIHLSRSCYDDKVLSPKEDSWITDFLMAVLDTSSANIITFKETLQSDPVLASPHWSYGMIDEDYIQRMKEKVQSLVPGAEVITCNDITDNTTALKVKLHLSVDDGFPEQALSIAQKIYEYADLDQSIFNTLTIYPTDTDIRQKEFADIVFQCHMGKDLLQDGVDVVSGRFFGGRMEQYQDEFRHFLTNSDFYRELGRNYQQFESPTGASGWSFGSIIFF